MQTVRSHSKNKFESLKKMDSEGNEYWLSSELKSKIGYRKQENFSKVIEAARNQLLDSGFHLHEHIHPISVLNQDDDLRLSRLGCYLVVINADSRKKAVADAHIYFALQILKQHKTEKKFLKIMAEEESHRSRIRKDIVSQNKRLVGLVRKMGVRTSSELAHFQDEGYRGLYGGLHAREIHELKNLKKNQHILDFMGIRELSANLFRLTQTIKQLEELHVHNPDQAVRIHKRMGEKIRRAMKQLGGEYPERLHSFGKVLVVKNNRKKEGLHVSQ